MPHFLRRFCPPCGTLSSFFHYCGLYKVIWDKTHTTSCAVATLNELLKRGRQQGFRKTLVRRELVWPAGASAFFKRALLSEHEHFGHHVSVASTFGTATIFELLEESFDLVARLLRVAGGFDGLTV